MPLDALRHLVVTWLRGRDERDRRAGIRSHAHRHRRLAAARAAEQQDDRHQKSMPRIARTPRSNACLTFRISVTVSASSMSSAGASRPVAITLTAEGLDRIAATTSAIGIQPQLIG